MKQASQIKPLSLHQQKQICGAAANAEHSQLCDHEIRPITPPVFYTDAIGEDGGHLPIYTA